MNRALYWWMILPAALAFVPFPIFSYGAGMIWPYLLYAIVFFFLLIVDIRTTKQKKVDTSLRNMAIGFLILAPTLAYIGSVDVGPHYADSGLDIIGAITSTAFSGIIFRAAGAYILIKACKPFGAYILKNTGSPVRAAYYSLGILLLLIAVIAMGQALDYQYIGVQERTLNNNGVYVGYKESEQVLNTVCYNLDLTQRHSRDI